MEEMELGEEFIWKVDVTSGTQILAVEPAITMDSKVRELKFFMMMP